MIMKTNLLFVLFLLSSFSLRAQTVPTENVEEDTVVQSKPHKENFLKRLDNWLAGTYFNSKYDTSYVARPRQRWLIRLMANQTGDYIHAKGTIKDVYSKYDLHTRNKTTVSLEVNYCDIAVALSVNPAEMSGKYKDYEFNFEYHNPKLSLDFNYQRSTSLKGDVKLDNFNHLDEDGLRLKVYNVTGIYTFNHRQFSFPAALYQNYYQLRSAGSWLAGVSFQGGSIRTTDELKQRSSEAPDVHLTVTNLGIGGGYGYNWALGHSRWLLHLSALPTFVVYQHNRLAVNGEDIRENRSNFNMIFNERAAVVYHFSPRLHAGTSLMMSNSVFDDENVRVRQNKFLVRAFIGVRF